MKEQLKAPLSDKLLYLSSVLVIILFSFFHHSSLFSPFLNSDDAVLVLMIHDFYLPQDLYYWGGNRGGTLIPLIGQFFHKVLQFSPIISESVSHYLILIAGFFGFTSLFRSKFIKTVFAVAWFLPPLRMIDVLKYNFGLQYSLIGISVFIINHMHTISIHSNRFRYHFFLLLVIFLNILTIWVSDTAVVTIFIILLIHFIFYFKKNKPVEKKLIFRQSELYYIIAGLFAGGLLIYYAKSHAVKIENFYDFLNIKIIADSFRIFTGMMLDLFLFRINEPFTSLYTYLILIFLLFLILKKKNIKYSDNQLKWMVIFILDLVIIFIVVISSKWANLNGVPRRYFNCNYISFWIAFLVAFEGLEIIKYKKILHYLLLFTAILGGLGTIYNFKYISPKKLTPTIKTVSEFERLGKIGIIAEYWNSYLSSVTNPAMIKATPNDMSEVRNEQLVDSVFAQPAIYVIRDMWMDIFPDTLEQFGYVLLKNGDEFRIGGCQVCNYQKIKVDKYYHLNQFKYHNALTYNDNKEGEVMYVSSDCDTCKGKHFVYGPYVPIGKGKFIARFYVRATEFSSQNPVALLDVTADYGMIILEAKEINQTCFSDTGFRYIDLNFETFKRYRNLEFRIFNYGNADLYFSHVKLKEK